MASMDPTMARPTEPASPLKSAALKGNPFRADISWQLLAIEAVAAIAVGIYALMDDESAHRNVITVIGIYLLVDGLSCAFGEVTSSEPVSMRDKFRLIRGGIGMSMGTIVVLERLFGFMELNATRVVIGLGLLGIGLVTVFGAIAGREESQLRLGGIGIALLLALWGIVVLYQANNDSDSMSLFGWVAIIVGVGLAGLALLRWRRTSGAGASRAHAGT